jgi:hypothetical protein
VELRWGEKILQFSMAHMLNAPQKDELSLSVTHVADAPQNYLRPGAVVDPTWAHKLFLAHQCTCATEWPVSVAHQLRHRNNFVKHARFNAPQMLFLPIMVFVLVALFLISNFFSFLHKRHDKSIFYETTS